MIDRWLYRRAPLTRWERLALVAGYVYLCGGAVWMLVTSLVR